MTGDELRNVLGPFADPATHFEVVDKGGTLAARIIREGETRAYVVDPSSEHVFARRDSGQTFASLDSMLASPDFADLRGMAATQQRLLKKVGAAPFLNPNLVIYQDGQERRGIEAFHDSLSGRANQRPRVVLLDGPAGIGKTRLLERLTWSRASGYLVGDTAAPILYVSSRGRRMSNLRDTLAGATEQVRPARFTSLQVPVLVRRNLLQLAIDGFDELVDSDGYQDAWYALRDFLDALGDGGTCILSGRDTFFDQQGFLDRLPSHTKIDLIQAHLLPTEPERAKSWLLERGWTEEDVASPVTDEVLRSDTYVLRPYFLSELAKAKGWDEVTRVSSVREFLINRFLEREADLLTKMIDIERPAAIEALGLLFREAALDMAERESSDIDLEYLTLLCEYAFEGRTSPDDLRKLQHKAGSFALFEQSATDRVRSFPHSEIFHHFLALALLGKLAAGDIHAVLRRAILGTDFLDVYQDVIDRYPPADLRSALGHLQAALSREISSDRLAPNGGALLVTALSREIPGLPRDLDHLDIYEGAVSGSMCRAKLTAVTVFRLDARGADMGQLEFSSCKVVTLIGDELTRFGATRPEVSMVQTNESGRAQTIRAHKDVLAWLDTHSRDPGDEADARSLPLVQYFERVCRRAIRQFYLRPGGDDAGAELLRDPLWPEVQAILRREGHLDEVEKPVSGTSAVLYHVRDARSLLSPSQSQTTARKVRAQVIDRAKRLAQ